MRKAAVRRVNEWDGPAMLKIYSPYTGTPCAPEAAPPPLQEYIARIDRYTYGLGWLMCEIDSIPAGFCHLTEDRNAPNDLFSVEFQLYVRSDLKRRGIGRAMWTLMRDMMELGSRRKVSVLFPPENEEAGAFFLDMGFRPVSEEGGLCRMEYLLAPADPLAERPVKPYLLENLDYERARERAAELVRL